MSTSIVEMASHCYAQYPASESTFAGIPTKTVTIDSSRKNFRRTDWLPRTDLRQLLRSSNAESRHLDSLERSILENSMESSIADMRRIFDGVEPHNRRLPSPRPPSDEELRHVARGRLILYEQHQQQARVELALRQQRERQARDALALMGEYPEQVHPDPAHLQMIMAFRQELEVQEPHSTHASQPAMVPEPHHQATPDPFDPTQLEWYTAPPDVQRANHEGYLRALATHHLSKYDPEEYSPTCTPSPESDSAMKMEEDEERYVPPSPRMSWSESPVIKHEPSPEIKQETNPWHLEQDDTVMESIESDEAVTPEDHTMHDVAVKEEHASSPLQDLGTPQQMWQDHWAAQAASPRMCMMLGSLSSLETR